MRAVGIASRTCNCERAAHLALTAACLARDGDADGATYPEVIKEAMSQLRQWAAFEEAYRRWPLPAPTLTATGQEATIAATSHEATIATTSQEATIAATSQDTTSGAADVVANAAYCDDVTWLRSRLFWCGLAIRGHALLLEGLAALECDVWLHAVEAWSGRRLHRSSFHDTIVLAVQHGGVEEGRTSVLRRVCQMANTAKHEVWLRYPLRSPGIEEENACLQELTLQTMRRERASEVSHAWLRFRDPETEDTWLWNESSGTWTWERSLQRFRDSKTMQTWL